MPVWYQQIELHYQQLQHYWDKLDSKVAYPQLFEAQMPIVDGLSSIVEMKHNNHSW